MPSFLCLEMNAVNRDIKLTVGISIFIQDPGADQTPCHFPRKQFQSIRWVHQFHKITHRFRCGALFFIRFRQNQQIMQKVNTSPFALKLITAAMLTKEHAQGKPNKMFFGIYDPILAARVFDSTQVIIEVRIKVVKRHFYQVCCDWFRRLRFLFTACFVLTCCFIICSLNAEIALSSFLILRCSNTHLPTSSTRSTGT